VEIIGEVKARQVAAADPQAAPQQNKTTAEAATPAAGAWSIQIASQPSEDDARQTYVGLASRYGDVLRGRGFNIVKADIAGKGTFWRVRIPAETRAEAVQLCQNYKSAGGSCFVTQ
jgi:cell division septation protein DedD